MTEAEKRLHVKDGSRRVGKASFHSILREFRAHLMADGDQLIALFSPSDLRKREELWGRECYWTYTDGK